MSKIFKLNMLFFLVIKHFQYHLRELSGIISFFEEISWGQKITDMERRSLCITNKAPLLESKCCFVSLASLHLSRGTSFRPYCHSLESFFGELISRSAGAICNWAGVGCCSGSVMNGFCMQPYSFFLQLTFWAPLPIGLQHLVFTISQLQKPCSTEPALCSLREILSPYQTLIYYRPSSVGLFPVEGNTSIVLCLFFLFPF